MPVHTQNHKPAKTAFVNKDEFDMDIDAMDDGDDNMADMLNLMQEFQRKKNAKSSTRNASLQSKLNALSEAAKKEAESMEKEGRAYIEHAKKQMDEFRSKEISWDELLKDSFQMWTSQENALESLLSIYPEMFDELSPQRSEIVNAASEMLEMHPVTRESSRRYLMKSARKNMELGMERQRLATDASILIKHYRALLLS